MSLKRSLSLPVLIFYGTGMILGAGIYSILGQAAGIAGEAVWQGFALAAVAAMLTALSYAELATMYPSAGGEYIYLSRAFSTQRWISGTVGIMVAFAGCAAAATVALAFASYLHHFIALPPLWVAATLVVFFTGVNVLGIKEASWVNVIFTLIEVLGLILFIWLGMQSPGFGDALFVVPTFPIISSAALIIFAYIGFENIVTLAEEALEPQRDIPRAILLSLLISTILYILVSLAAVAMMPPEELARTDSAVMNAALNHSPRLAGILGGIALFSTANTALIALISASRILYGIAKDRSLPAALAKTLPKRKTPWVAAIVAALLTLSVLTLGKVKILASVASFATMAVFIAVNLALLVLRHNQPGMDRSFRVPFSVRNIAILPVLAILCCTVFLFQFEREIYVVGLFAFVTSAGVYFVFRQDKA